MLNISNLYAYIHATLSNDAQMRDLLGMSAEPTLIERATKVQKRQKPQTPVKDSVPLVSFFMNPGSRGVQNHLEYNTTFDFDIYTEDDVELALKIADRIHELFDGKYLALPCGNSFRAEFITCAEVPSDLDNTYRFFTQILFSLALER